MLQAQITYKQQNKKKEKREKEGNEQVERCMNYFIASDVLNKSQKIVHKADKSNNKQP